MYLWFIVQPSNAKQKAATMTTTERIIHKRSKPAGKGATRNPLSSVQLTGIDAPTNRERLAEYVSKRTAMESAA